MFFQILSMVSAKSISTIFLFFVDAHEACLASISGEGVPDLDNKMSLSPSTDSTAAFVGFGLSLDFFESSAGSDKSKGTNNESVENKKTWFSGSRNHAVLS